MNDTNRPSHHQSHRRLRYLIASLTLMLTVVGCASKGFVRREIETTNEKLEDVQGQVEANQDRISEQGDDIERQDGEIDAVEGATQEASKTATDALDRAIAAGKLAEGKFVFETVLSDDDVRFGFDRADIGDEAHGALATFAEQLKSNNENVFIEIQGHTDSTGPEDYNLTLGEERAEAVRRALNKQHGIALHRMSVISYGESEPITENNSRENRAQNRRVVLVVLK